MMICRCNEIPGLTATLDGYRHFAGLVRALLAEHDDSNGVVFGEVRPDSPATAKIRASLALQECPEPVRCDRCAVACGDFRQRDGERVCLLCVERDLDQALDLLSTLVHWHDRDGIDESWWDEARRLTGKERP